MTHREIVTVLQTSYLGTHWNLTGNTYEGLVWLDDPATKPSAMDLGLE